MCLDRAGLAELRWSLAFYLWTCTSLSGKNFMGPEKDI